MKVFRGLVLVAFVPFLIVGLSILCARVLAQDKTSDIDPKLYLVPEGEYLNSTYVIGESMTVRARFDAGEGSVVSDQGQGIEFLLRRVNANWEVISDLAVNDRGAIGKRRGLSTVSIPLGALLPSPDLPPGEFYLLFVHFISSSGVNTNTPGVAPIFIVSKDKAVSNKIEKVVQVQAKNVDEGMDLSVPFLRLNDSARYINEIYADSDRMYVSTVFNAGEGKTVDKSKGGIGYYLRRVDNNWNIFSDIIIYDRSAIGRQSGVSSAQIPLNDLVPSSDLPDDQYYFLYAQFSASDGSVHDIPGVAPVTIIKKLATDGGSIANLSKKDREVVIAVGDLAANAFRHETVNKGRRCEDIKKYNSPKLLSRSVIELVLICQAFRSVGNNISLRFVIAPNYSRSLELVKSGSAHMMAESAWDDDIDKQELYVTEPIIQKGEYFKGIYSTEEKLMHMKIKSAEDLRRYTALTPTHWHVDLKALRSIGVTNKLDVHVPMAIIKMIHNGRGDYMLGDFTRQNRMAISDGELLLYPVQGVKIALYSERRFVLSRKADPDGELVEVINQGINNLRKQNIIKQAFSESGFFNNNVGDWRVLNDSIN
ncbi:hypothetical protein [Agaribacterium haliotis]|uniref:hypothetical protein n=1 Tax=Agaribacterium haliotis TaxID=2013869 RepID=UPI000BB54414|nr:hypothetical protein [Agaribacterium haliotis]